MANSGICNFQENTRSLLSFVADILFKDKELPGKSNRRFYPNQKDIQNHYNLAFSTQNLAQSDQENVSCFMDKCLESSNLGDKVLFRSYIAITEDMVDTANENVSCPKSNFNVDSLSTKWHGSGNNCCDMDRIFASWTQHIKHQHTHLLRLFFAFVKTYVEYQVIATIIVQNGIVSDIQAAFNTLKSQNPNSKPQFFVTDNARQRLM